MPNLLRHFRRQVVSSDADSIPKTKRQTTAFKARDTWLEDDSDDEIPELRTTKDAIEKAENTVIPSTQDADGAVICLDQGEKDNAEAEAIYEDGYAAPVFSEHDEGSPPSFPEIPVTKPTAHPTTPIPIRTPLNLENRKASAVPGLNSVRLRISRGTDMGVLSEIDIPVGTGVSGTPKSAKWIRRAVSDCVSKIPGKKVGSCID